MPVRLATEKSNPTGTTFEKKFVALMNSVKSFLKNENISEEILVVPFCKKSFVTNDCSHISTI